ncbi:response regulator [Tengunoibacter tsumagoiensis]|uniref:Response regulatory domain-containing protein n=1 Tax=Tengunoibacter tsumagoiensis TaxID=2014871 RepID=A0A402A3M3_9CHLR|nr:response regulator [Tengunoibacter tsumagoiensis]GCE13747.1 hypothetical protein KTT_36060 [Tengunoibacter tsumagoiensis]
MRVGLLEDDIAIQEMLRLVLQDEGYTVINFADATACLEAFHINQPVEEPIPVDLMIVDWRLSDTTTGTEVIQQLRQDPRLRTLPIILTTAATFSNFEQIEHLQISFLEKPFSVDEMTDLIKEITTNGQGE